MDTKVARHSTPRVHRIRATLDLVTTVMVFVAAVAVIAVASRNWLNGPAVARRSAPQVKTPDAAQSLDGATRLGSRQAPVALVIYSDFECPFCGKFAAETWPSIKKDYVATDKVQVVFRHLPLTIHQHARDASLNADCAAKQNKFWEVHDVFFQHQRELTSDRLRAMAEQSGVELSAFDECLAHNSGDVQRDLDSASRLGINSTPTFLVGRVQKNGTVKVAEVLMGAKPLQAFRRSLDPLLIASGTADVKNARYSGHSF